MTIDSWLPTLAVLTMGLGSLLMLVAAIGLLRMPDVYLRLHCATKAATLGIGLVVLGAALHYQTFNVWLRCLAIIVFFLLTAPVGAHMLGRAAYRRGVALADETLSDDLIHLSQEQFQAQDHRGAVEEDEKIA